MDDSIVLIFALAYNSKHTPKLSPIFSLSRWRIVRVPSSAYETFKYVRARVTSSGSISVVAVLGLYDRYILLLIHLYSLRYYLRPLCLILFASDQMKEYGEPEFFIFQPETFGTLVYPNEEQWVSRLHTDKSTS